jgi:hypothetical protein
VSRSWSTIRFFWHDIIYHVKVGILIYGSTNSLNTAVMGYLLMQSTELTPSGSPGMASLAAAPSKLVSVMAVSMPRFRVPSAATRSWPTGRNRSTLAKLGTKSALLSMENSKLMLIQQRFASSSAAKGAAVSSDPRLKFVSSGERAALSAAEFKLRTFSSDRIQHCVVGSCRNPYRTQGSRHDER